MKNLFIKTSRSIALTPKPYARMLPAVLLSLCGLLTLSACQKAPEPEAETETEVQSTAVTSSIDESQSSEDVVIVAQSAEELAAETEREADLAALENNIGAEGVTPNAETTTPSPEQAIAGTQITDVHYRSAAGETLSVVFETSATGVLNAIVTLPNKPAMTLSAPEGQGNNPTYRSADGSVELVSHGGGSSIDLMQNNKVTNFEAISAEAEVLTQT